MGVGVQNNVVEAVGGQLVEKPVHGRQFGVGRIQRPQPVTFVTHREEAGAILADEMAQVLRINSHAAMNLRRVRCADDLHTLAVQRRHRRMGHKLPLALHRGREADFPGPVAVVETWQNQLGSVRPGELGGEGRLERIIQL
jgi:hypothetical protein